MGYKLSPKGVQFTEKQEGIVPYIYDDAVYPTRMWKGETVHGHLTAGVGHLLNTNEIAKYKDKQIERATIDAWFDFDNNIAEAAVSRLVTVRLLSNQADVLIDFTFNNNPAALANSTLLKRVNAQQFDRVPAELMKWTKTHIDGKLVNSPGLQKRAADRSAYWLSAGTEITPHSGPSGTPVAVPTPHPTSPLEWAGLGVSGLSGLSGLSGVGGFFGVALGVVLIGGFVIAAAIIVKRQFFTK